MKSPAIYIHSRNVVTPDGMRDAVIEISNGRIMSVTDSQQQSEATNVQDYGSLVIMPGLVDSHVHINEPGRTAWEGFETATKAAAAGGITTLVDMPLNSTPVTTTLQAFKEKLSAAKGKLWVDAGFYAGLIPGNTDELQPMMDAGVLGVKAFLVHSGIDDFPNASESDLRRGMPLIANAGLPLLVHCELTNQQTSDIQHPTSYREYLSSRPRQWEHDAIALMIRLCREYNCRTHIVHLASADAVPMLSEARSSGLPLTVETCPHYLFFSAENIPDGDTRFKCAPPIRENENRERLWDALREKVIDGIVSDHSPAPPELKHLDAGDFTKAWGGISSLQFGLSIIWTEARKRGYHYSDIARWMSWFPAQLAGLTGRKGAIAEGYDADIVVWNPEVSYTLTRGRILHRHKVTPYEGSVLYGVVEKTFVRGTAVYDNGLLSDTPHGVIVTK